MLNNIILWGRQGFGHTQWCSVLTLAVFLGIMINWFSNTVWGAKDYTRLTACKMNTVPTILSIQPLNTIIVSWHFLLLAKLQYFYFKYNITHLYSFKFQTSFYILVMFPFSMLIMEYFIWAWLIKQYLLNIMVGKIIWGL